MKKLVTLFAAAGMVMAASAPAAAVDTKVDYRHRISFQTGSEDFKGTNTEQFKSRVRLGLTFAASENLKGYTQFQLLNDRKMGDTGGTHGATDDATVRQMYIDWTVPATAVKVRMGRMELGLPGDAFGENAVMAAGYGSRDGIVVTAPVADWLGLSALWTRVNYDACGTLNANDLDQNKSDDIYAAVANLKFDGVSASVYAAYATLDGGAPTKRAAGDTLPKIEGDAYWVGFTSAFTFFDPFTLKLSAAYGEAAADNGGFCYNGWNVQAKASYKTSFGTPVLGAWYFSGDDDKWGDGTMPSVQGAFTPTRAYHDGSKGLNGGAGVENPNGNWGVQLGIEKVSFLQGLSHDFLVSYIAGTNEFDAVLYKDAESKDRGVGYLTDEDSFVAFDFISTYQIYKNLAAHLELSYFITDFAKEREMDEDGFNAELTFEYKF